MRASGCHLLSIRRPFSKTLGVTLKTLTCYIVGGLWSWTRAVGNLGPHTHRGKSWRGLPCDVTPHPATHRDARARAQGRARTHRQTHTPCPLSLPPKLVAFSSQSLGCDLKEFRQQQTEWPWGCPRPTADPSASRTSERGCSWGSREALPPPPPQPWQGGE